MKVLIVEDEAILSIELEWIVEDAGHEVVGIATTRQQALALAPLAEAALVDCRLQDGYTGPEVGRRLVQDFGISVFYTTGNFELIRDDLGGALGVLAKPYCPWHVRDALEVAEGHRSRAGWMVAVV